MKVYPCGLWVTTNSESIRGMITAINIRFDQVNYEISYFYNGEHRSVWLSDNEFIPDKGRHLKTIGFKNKE